MSCPGCHLPPVFLVGRQAWCGNALCRVLSWDPDQSMDELLDDFGTVDLSRLEGGL